MVIRLPVSASLLGLGGLTRTGQALRTPYPNSHASLDADWGDAAVLRKCPEAELARLARATGVLRRVQAAIAARLIDSKTHDRLCYTRLGDYARERAGVSGRQLQELPRVHRSLEDVRAEMTRDGTVASGERVVLIFGTPIGHPGATNSIRVEQAP